MTAEDPAHLSGDIHFRTRGTLYPPGSDPARR